MADKTNLDKQIEAALKANLNSISASDDLIARTLARLEENKQTVVTPMPVKKKKRIPVAIISTIAAAAIALVGGVFVFASLNNAKGTTEKSLDMAFNNLDSNDSVAEEAAEVKTEAITSTNAATIFNEDSVDIETDGEVPVAIMDEYKPSSFSSTVISYKKYTNLSLSLSANNSSFKYSSHKSPYFSAKNGGRILPDGNSKLEPYALNGNDPQAIAKTVKFMK